MIVVDQGREKSTTGLTDLGVRAEDLRPMPQCENRSMNRYSLPHNAKGIESDDYVVSFGGDKIVFVPKTAGRGKHYTLHVGPDSGVIDLHETQPAPAGDEQHRTLFAVRRDDLTALLGDTAAILPELMGLLRPLRLGWLKHRNIGVARGIDPVSDDDIAAVTRKHRRRLTIDPQLYEENVYVPDYLEEVYDFPDGSFSLHHRGRQIGIGFKKTDQEGAVSLFWIKLRDLRRFGNVWQGKIAAELTRVAIPQDRYAEYAFLSS